MKKVINITIGQRVFSIEEDAYTELQKYLKNIGKYFQEEEASGEIIQDIEDSISEKLSIKKKNLQKSVTHGDIIQIIWELWTIEELSQEDESDYSQENKGREEKEKKSIKRLYRNGEDKIIAGVWSGIANYIGIDPVITRILFVLLLFVNGMWFLAYIVLWIVVPLAKTSSQKRMMIGEETNLESIEKFVWKQSQKQISKTLHFIPSLIGWLVLKIIWAMRIIFGTFVIFISSVLIFAVFTLFIWFLTGWNALHMDMVTKEAFNELLQVHNYIPLILTAFVVCFVPLFLVLLWWFDLLLKRKIIGLNIFIFLFIMWMLSLSYLVIQVFENTQTIENIAKIMGEEVIDWEEREFHITIRNYEDEGE